MEKVSRDIFFNIFSRLPLKSVIRSCCVSKLWLDMIKDPSFVKLYISQSHPDPSLLILTHRMIGEKNIVSISPLNHKGFQLAASESAISHMVSSFSWDLVGTCNGLICFTSSDKEEVTMVCNPVTREHITLPKPTITSSSESYARMLSFGFDPVGKKYKVVRLLCSSSVSNTGTPTRVGSHTAARMRLHAIRDHYVGLPAGLATHATTRADVRAEVYTLGSTDSWSEVQGFNYCPHGKPVYAKGIQYWLVDDLYADDRILSFDLGSEQFKLTQHHQFGIQISLAELGSCLAVVDLSSNDLIEISVLKDPINNIWEMRYILPLSRPRSLDRQSPRLICVYELKNILVVWLEDRLLSYDSSVFLTKDLKITGFPTWLDWDICSGYRWSLVPLGNSYATGDDRRDVVHFVSDKELHSLLAKGGTFCERRAASRCDYIVASFQKNGLLM